MNDTKHDRIVMARRYARALVFSAVCTAPLAAFAQSPSGEQAKGHKATVELYTSQGCSSCPPADVLLHALAQRKDVIALTFPVDYWDYLGWKDTFAAPRNSERQRAYAKARGDGLIYTPQAVVNGVLHVNGASRTAIEQAIGTSDVRLKALQVPVKLSADRGKLVIEASARTGNNAGDATIWLAAVQRHGEVVIGKGENGGRKLSYTNVVRELIPIGTWSGKAEAVRIDRQSIAPPGTDTYAVLIQQGHAGPILGAAWLDDSGS